MSVVRIVLVSLMSLSLFAGGEEDDIPKRTIRWKTASEVDNFGFDVFRAEKEEGPFIKLNDKPISGAGTSDEPQSYVYVDKTIDPAKPYFYYVESISMTGVRERFTPVYNVPPYNDKKKK